MKKKALITGITGQDGSYLAEHLLGLDYEVHGIVRRVALEQPEHRLSRLRGVLDKIKIHPANLDSYASIFHVFSREQYDECYHLAAQSFVAESFRRRFLHHGHEHQRHPLCAGGASRIAAQCKFYFAGSSEMFGKVRETPQRESTPFHPRSPYGISKCAGFQLAVNYREAYGMYLLQRHSVQSREPAARPGVRHPENHQRRGAHQVRAGLGTAPGNLEAKRDWGHARDYVRAMHLMLQQPARGRLCGRHRGDP